VVERIPAQLAIVFKVHRSQQKQKPSLLAAVKALLTKLN
jgi:hypothetical protein